MLEKPDIAESRIVECLQRQYGLDVRELQFLAIGNDVNTAVYRVDVASGRALFAKLRSDDFFEPAVTVPRLLYEQGIPSVISPLPALSQRLYTRLDPFVVSVYPFIEGKNGFASPLTDVQWRELGRTLKALHQLEPPDDGRFQIPRETYAPTWRDRTRDVLRLIEHEEFEDRAAAMFAEFIASKRPAIERLLQRAETLALTLRGEEIEFVLCHGDIHAGNVLIAPDGELYVIDWDTLALAPKERDLMFIGGAIGGTWNTPHEDAMFYRGYGATVVHPGALAYYRCERFMEDVAEYSERLLLTPDGGEDRENGVMKFKNAFEANNVVDVALRHVPISADKR